jgi:hypothetical protein
MRHARAEALDRLEPVLAEIRALPGLTEKSRGIFYRKARAFLHFHEDPAGLFADLRAADGGDFERIDLTEATARVALVQAAKARLQGLADHGST